MTARKVAATYFLFSTILVTPFAVVDWKPSGARASIYLIGIALTLLVGPLLIVLACLYASAVKVGPFIYTVIVFTALIDWCSGTGRRRCSFYWAWRW